MITQRRKITGDGKGRRSRADNRNSLAIWCHWPWHPMDDIVLEIGSDTLEPADCDWIFLDAAAPAGRLAGAVTGPAQNSWKDIRFPVDHVGVAVATLRNQPDIFRDWGVG